jgi:hypothetical protein
MGGVKKRSEDRKQKTEEKNGEPVFAQASLWQAEIRRQMIETGRHKT